MLVTGQARPLRAAEEQLTRGVVDADKQGAATLRVQLFVESQDSAEVALRATTGLSGIAHALSMWAAPYAVNPGKV